MTPKSGVKGKNSGWLFWGILVLLAMIVVFPVLKSNAQTKYAAIGKQAPQFDLNNLEGQKVSLADIKGKPVIINFWASWCPPCRLEMPALEKVYQESSRKGFALLMVNQEEDRGTVQAFLKQNNYSFPVLLDTNGQVSRAYRVSGIPTSVFIDSDGIIRDIHVGTMPAAEWFLAKIPK